ncbi:MAG: cupin domain-containing protein [Planctomycetota bacterium]
MQSKIELQNIEPKEIMPGFRGRFLHTGQLTLAYWNIDASAALPLHDHPHEQVVNVLEGEFELTFDGHPHHLTAGDVFILQPGVPHSGRAITACRILDIFHPVRSDYQDE